MTGEGGGYRMKMKKGWTLPVNMKHKQKMNWHVKGIQYNCVYTVSKSAMASQSKYI